MPKKLKMIYLKKILEEMSDRDHPLSVKDIALILDSWGIKAERKSIYDDIDALRAYGMKIRNRRKKPSGFYLEDHSFALGEMKLLMDAVQSSRFITREQTQTLLKKLEGLTTIYDVRRLQSQNSAEGAVKTTNEEVYKNMELIYTAMEENCQISFRYYEWTTGRKLVAKKNGQRYRVSPWKVVWNNESYYLLGVDELSGVVKHYRIDKMRHVSSDKRQRNGAAIFRDFDLGKFSGGTFGMFGGRETLLKLEFENRLIGVVMDRFGKDSMILTTDEEHFTFQAHIRVSGQFFGWLAGLGQGVRILSPEKTRKEYAAFLRQALEGYEDRDGSKKNSKIQTIRASGTE